MAFKTILRFILSALVAAHAPDHNIDDGEHLAPAQYHVLYYAQEGHRPAVHGAKHATFRANFSRPTIVLDHSSQLKSIRCKNGKINICFKSNSTGFVKASNTWTMKTFNLATYHIGCGDETSGQRSYFLAENPQFDHDSGCVEVAAKPLAHEEAIASGERSNFYQPETGQTSVCPAVDSEAPDSCTSRVPRHGMPGNATNGTDPDAPPFPPDFFKDLDDTSPRDITDDLQALINFFQTDNFDTSDISDLLQWFEDLDFIDYDGTLLAREARQLLRRRIMQRRGWGLFEGIYNAAKALVNKIGDYVSTAVKTILGVGDKLVSLAIVAAKVIAVPFGVPFDESATNRPPQIFGYTNGFNLVDTGGVYSNFHVDAVFGVTLEVQYGKPIEALNQPIASVPMSPLTISGIITLGPQLTISGSLDLVLNGQAELLIGSSLKIAPGEARLSLVEREDNSFTGFETAFDPVAKFNGALTASVELGLPITIEVGVEILNVKFKKTVGLTNKPSVYGMATLNLNLPVLCKGVTLSVGVESRIYISAIGFAEGFNSLISVPDLTVTTAVPLAVGGDIANIKPNITDVSAGLIQNITNNMGFKVIMNEDRTSILVSGKDAFVYLVDTQEAYDVSSPWGSVNLASGTINFDVFGRVLSAFTPVKSSDGKTRYTVVYTVNGVTVTYFPTFCKTPAGLRLYPTYYLIDVDGNIQTTPVYQQAVREGFNDFYISDPLGLRELPDVLVRL
ncbi:uncharacterized protein B0T15DRAFT_559308 [Chaetomium strumarium]|uniref:Uncharacterized protein n=1 Tax=Chaetomium strumarium TaxID=1170767 RepID=A0AAJ0GNA5_9PEZI|nr:hypothetical protein B0T15DRAFT_559308 [Chaetomium strumarium]